MNDRKHKYTDDQLDKFIEFKDLVARTIKDQPLLDNLWDNVYCRFLEGFQWDFELALQKITVYLVWAKQNNVFALNPEEDFKHLASQKFVHLIGKDRDNRPVLYFCIKNFVPAELDSNEVGVYYGVFVNHCLRTYSIFSLIVQTQLEDRQLCNYL